MSTAEAAGRWTAQPKISPTTWGTSVDDDTDADDVLDAGDIMGSPVAGPVDIHLLPLPDATVGQKMRALLDGERGAVAPTWVTDRTARTQALGRVGADARYLAKVGAVHSPKVAGKAAWWSLRGASLLGWRLVRWCYDQDGHPLAGAIQAQDDKTYLRMVAERSQRQRFRLIATAAVTVLLLVGLLLLASRSRLLLLPVAVVALVAFARAGKPEGARLASPALTAEVRPRLTSLQIVRGLSALGITQLTKALEVDSSRIWRSPISVTRGGYRTHLQLPVGVLASDLVAHEQRLSAALGRPADTVIVEPLPHVTPGDLILWIMDKPMLSASRGPGPLHKARKASWWSDVQVGITRIGATHAVALRGGAWFLGGQPSSGKSSLLRVAAAHTALDPHALVVIVALKGAPDFIALKPVCHKYLSGAPESDPTIIPQTVALLRWLLAECARRNDFLTALVERGKATTADVTEDLAKAHPELAPMTVILDEVHRLFDRSDNAEFDETVELLGKVIKAVRSVAITVVAATQLAGSESVPPVITRAARVRGCLTVQDEVSWRQIFGTAGKGSFAASGVASLPPGSVILKAEDGGSIKVGTFHIKPEHLTEIGRRALALRTDLHLLTGQAAGETSTTSEPVDPADLLRHVLEALPTTAPAGTDDSGVAWVADLEDVLGAREEYTGRAAGWLGNELRARRVPTAQLNRRVPVEGGGTRQRNSAGVRATDVRTALEAALTDG